MKEDITSAWATVRQFAQAIPLPMALNPHSGGGGGQFLYSSRSSILPEALVSVICSIVPGCVSAALYDHVSLDDKGKGAESDDMLLQETTDDEQIVRCRAIALRRVLNGTAEWTSAQILQQAVLPDSQSRIFLHQSTSFHSSSSKNAGSVQCSPPPLETDAAISGVSMFYVPLPGRDAALELACTEESKAAEHVALAITPFFSTFLAWRDKVTENLVSSAMKAFSIAVQRIAFRHLAIHMQRGVKSRLELRMEDMETKVLHEREELRRSRLEMEKERSELCKQQQLQSQLEEGGDRSTTKSRDKENHQGIRENMLDIKVRSIVRDEEDVAAAQQHESIMKQQDMAAALENELLSVNVSFSKEREKLDMQLDELRGISKIKEALELQAETLKSEMMLVREEQRNDNNQWQLQVEELQSKLSTVTEWHENSLKENEDLQKNVELMSISLRDANIENAYLHERFKDLESELHAAQKERDDGFRSLTENVQQLRQHLCDCTLKLKNAEDEKQQFQSELDHFVLSANEDNRDLLGQLEELKLQLQKAKNKEDGLHSELVAVEKERTILNERFLRNSQDLELKLSTALAERSDAIQAKSNAWELAKQQLEQEKQQFQSELETEFASAADEGRRDLLRQLEELKIQLQKEKNEQNVLRFQLMAIEEENGRFLRNSHNLELKLSTALAERSDAIQAKSNAWELAKQQLEDVKLSARREIDTLQLKLEEECMKLRSMTDSHTAKEGLLQSQIEAIQRNLYLEESKHDSELKTAIQRHLGTDLALSEEISSFEDLLSHLKAKHSFEIQEREKAFRFQLNSAESRLMEEKAGLQSQLDATRTELRALQDDVLILSREKESTKSKVCACIYPLQSVLEPFIFCLHFSSGC